jgi:4-amino-4-deoxy-L-arabinose transferase-like glycosyltransferase
MRRGPLFVLLLSSVMFVAGLGWSAIGDSDEAFYAEASREMLASGDWLTPTFNFDSRFQKPVLYYWLTAATYAVAGVSETAARWWSAMSGLALALLVFWAARRWFDTATAEIAGAVAATTLGCALMARLALPDLPLTALTTATIVFALVAIFDEQRSSLCWMLAAAFMAGLAMLAKGPVGPLVAFLAVGGAIVADRRNARVRPVDLILAAVAFLLIAAPWYAAMAARHGVAYLSGFFVGDNLERFATTRFNDPRPIWFYLPVIATGLLPWTAFMTLWLAAVPRWRERLAAIGPRERRLIVWALLPLVFFSVSVGKQPRYVLPVFPPLAILLARTITARIARATDDRRDDALLRSCGALAGVTIVLLGVLLYRLGPLVEGDLSGAVRLALSGGTMAAGAFSLLVSLRARLSRMVPAIACAVCVWMVAHTATLASGDDAVERIASLVRVHHHGSGPVGTFRTMVRNLVFYTHLPSHDLTTEDDLARFVERPERLLVVLTRDDREKFETARGRTLRVLGSVRYFNSAILTARTLVVPDPARDVSEVEVVSTR